MSRNSSYSAAPAALALFFVLLAARAPAAAEEGHDHHDHGAHGHGHDEHHEEEGHTEISPRALESSGVTISRAGEVILRPKLQLPGRVFPSEHGIAHIVPRFPGVVREGKKHVGDAVEKGEVMAVIESNQSLQPYELRAQISGTVIDGHLILGEFVPENEPVFVIANINEVWVDIRVPKTKAGTITAGRKVVVRVPESGISVQAKIDYLAPYLDDVTQTRLARAIVANPEHTLLPGTFITADIMIEEIKVPVAVRTVAVQSIQDSKVIFVKQGEAFTSRPVVLGRSDEDWVEVLEGLKAGEEYVSKNSFIIKADILKSGAAHEH